MQAKEDSTCLVRSSEQVNEWLDAPTFADGGLA